MFPTKQICVKIVFGVNCNNRKRTIEKIVIKMIYMLTWRWYWLIDWFQVLSRINAVQFIYFCCALKSRFTSKSKKAAQSNLVYVILTGNFKCLDIHTTYILLAIIVWQLWALIERSMIKTLAIYTNNDIDIILHDTKQLNFFTNNGITKNCKIYGCISFPRCNRAVICSYWLNWNLDEPQMNGHYMVDTEDAQ